MILPPPAASFTWRWFEGRPGLVCEPLAALAPHLFSTAHWPLGMRTSSPGSDEGWPAMARAVGVDDGRLIRVRQVHGTTVVAGPLAPDRQAPSADIIVLHQPQLAAAVQAADCVPLLMADSATGAVAAVHAGWRGLAARAPQVAIAALADAYASHPSDLVVALGPSIGACCYEVGRDVRDAFAAAGFGESMLRRWFAEQPAAIDGNPAMAAVRDRPRRADRWFFDGWSAAAAQLIEAGVGTDRIFGAGLCTASHPDVFCSYGATGRDRAGSSALSDVRGRVHSGSAAGGSNHRRRITTPAEARRRRARRRSTGCAGSCRTG